MPDITFYLRPLSAREALEKCSQVAARVFPSRPVTLSLGTSVNSLTLTIPDTQSTQIPMHVEVARLRDQLQRAHFPIDCTQFSLADRQNPNQTPRPLVRFNRADGIASQLVLENFPTPDSIIDASEILSSAFNFAPQHQLVGANLPQPQQEALRFQETATAELRTQVEKLGEFILSQVQQQEDFFRQLTTQYDTRARTLEEQLRQEVQKERDDLAASRREVDESLRLRVAELDDRERQHKLAVAEHDSRQSTYVRRELLTKMQKIIDERARETAVLISSKTEKKRFSIHVLCVAALFVGAALVLGFGYQVVHDSGPLFHHIAPLSAGLFVLASTLIYYIKWNDQWYREHAQAELHNQKFNSDIHRASWLAELVFEAKGVNLPEVLVNRFSEGLFVDRPSDGPQHPVDQLAGLVAKVSNIKVSPGAVELTKSAAKERQ
jgi:hypothetical protein